MAEFSPHLKILPPAQRRLWPELGQVPRDFVLYGGTALALHLGHRESADFDFFSRRALDLNALQRSVPFLSGAKVTQRMENTLTAEVERGGLVKISFFGLPWLSRLEPPHIVRDTGLQVASLLDLAGTKASVVQQRALARDYVDIDALMRLGSINLPTALAAAQKIFGPSFNAMITLKALTYFGDAPLCNLPEDMKVRLASAAREVDLEHLPSLQQAEPYTGRGFGHDP